MDTLEKYYKTAKHTRFLLCLSNVFKITPWPELSSTTTLSISGVVTKDVDVDLILNALLPDEFDGRRNARETRELMKQ